MVAPTRPFGHPTVLISATVAIVNTVLRLASGFVSPSAVVVPSWVFYLASLKKCSNAASPPSIFKENS